MGAPHKIVILGGGTGGTLTANRLHRELGAAADITVVDQDDAHVYQPALLFLPFGLAAPESMIRSRAAQLHPGIHLIVAGIDRVDVPPPPWSSQTVASSHTTCSSSRPTSGCCRRPRA